MSVVVNVFAPAAAEITLFAGQINLTSISNSLVAFPELPES